jgi:AcrR family transcriptional regulator
MARRAELVDETRQRITEAAVRLHTTIGPANTTISGVADEAGVTRLTVYRHFADLDSLFVACRGHWLAGHPPPDAASWTAIDPPALRIRRALSETYDWYRRNAADLYPINRDEASMPATARAQRAEQAARRVEALVGDLTPATRAGQVTRAVAGHALEYWTWRSLTVNGGLSQDEAVEVGVGLVLSTL